MAINHTLESFSLESKLSSSKLVTGLVKRGRGALGTLSFLSNSTFGSIVRTKMFLK